MALIVPIVSFDAITHGYAESVRGMLTKKEVTLLHIAPRVTALTLGVRFLTDFLIGDTCFRTHRKDHDLERAHPVQDCREDGRTKCDAGCGSPTFRIAR